MTATTSPATAPATLTADAALEEAEEEEATVCRASTHGINVHMIIATCYNGIDDNRVRYCCPSIQCGTFSGSNFRFTFHVK